MEETNKSKEFTEWLTSIGGLENGYFPDREPITSRYYFSFGDGWLDLVKELIEKAIALGWDKKILQSKEKFGSMRFYISSAPSEVHDLVTEYERKSFEVCEECGAIGELRQDLSWIRTLCNEHYENLKK